MRLHLLEQPAASLHLREQLLLKTSYFCTFFRLPCSVESQTYFVAC